MTTQLAPTVSDCFINSFNDHIFVTVFISSWIIFLILQQIGETVWKYTLTEAQKKNTSRIEFGVFYQSSTHALIIFIGALLTFYDSNNWIYKYITIISCTYYLNNVLYEFLIPQSWSYRMIMVIHHFFCGFGQFPVYVLGGILQLISALNFQCEISNLFMNLSWFSKQYESCTIYKLSGIGVLITFPITRCIIVPIAFYKIYYLENGILPIEYYWFAVIAEIFVLIMSYAYTGYILLYPNKLLIMDTVKQKIP